MGLDSPDGMSRGFSKAYSELLSQDVVSHSISYAGNIDPSRYAVCSFINDNENLLYLVTGFRLYNLNGVTWHAYVKKDLWGLGYYRVVGQYECFFPERTYHYLNYGSAFIAYLYNDDAVAQSLGFVVNYNAYIKPENWQRKPEASITVDDSTPTIGQTVQFTDASYHDPVEWYWSFGDGGISTFQNPTHAYTVAGTYTVTLTVSNNGGKDSTTRTVTVT